MLTEKEIKEVAEKISYDINKGRLHLVGKENVVAWAVRFHDLDVSQVDEFFSAFTKLKEMIKE